MALLTGYAQWITFTTLVTLLNIISSYAKGSGEVDTVLLFVLVVVGLAIFGAVAVTFGSDSRQLIDDAHASDQIRRTI
jgi:hypothetical protein